MLNIKTLLTDDLTVWADFPGYPGFEVNIRYISRDIARKLREENTENVWDSTLKRSREKLKEDQFISAFAKKSVVDWKGLTVKNLRRLLPVKDDLPEGVTDETELDYSEEAAEYLINKSPTFDSWVNDIVMDLESFRNSAKKSDN